MLIRHQKGWIHQALEQFIGKVNVGIVFVWICSCTKGTWSCGKTWKIYIVDGEKGTLSKCVIYACILEILTRYLRIFEDVFGQRNIRLFNHDNRTTLQTFISVIDHIVKKYLFGQCKRKNLNHGHEGTLGTVRGQIIKFQLFPQKNSKILNYQNQITVLRLIYKTVKNDLFAERTNSIFNHGNHKKLLALSDDSVKIELFTERKNTRFNHGKEKTLPKLSDQRVKIYVLVGRKDTRCNHANQRIEGNICDQTVKFSHFQRITMGLKFTRLIVFLVRLTIVSALCFFIFSLQLS